MILGTAKMEISEATVVLALQEYFDKRAATGFSPVVKAVASASSNGYGGKTFTVEVSEPEPTAEKVA